MSDIYQEIWSTDQAHNGIEAILSDQTGDPAKGFVKVNRDLEDNRDPNLRVLTEVHIPDHKRSTYDLCRALFNNYALPEGDFEIDTEDERTERHTFIEAIRDTPPMQVARAYVADQTGQVVTSDRWHNTLVEMWFRRFSQGGDPELTGFEHVVVGEQEGGKVQGYHYWHKYFLDDGFARQVDDGLAVVPGLSDDRIVYEGPKTADGQMDFPETVTISFRWNAPDYERNAVRPLFKRIGGFFVGCSVEGLMALGTVRAHKGARAPKTAVIEGARYDMKLFRSPNDAHIRTFYPVFKGASDPVRPGPSPLPPMPRPPVALGGDGDVRILAAMVNPEGHDPGSETVTIINAGPTPVDSRNWQIVDKNGNTSSVQADNLDPGVPHLVRLPKNEAQLGNKGGTITLRDGSGTTLHTVSYTKAQAKRQNATVIF